MKRLLIAVALVAILAGCHSPSEPNDQAAQPHGRLAGVVTIGPNCPVTTTSACPTPPDAYSQRKILVYNTDKSRLLFTVDIDSQGAYTILLVPGTYTIDFKPAGIDHSADLPKSVDIHANVTSTVNVNIDTGLR
jgi:hypothetical protein